MKVKVIKVNIKLFGPDEQELIRDGEVDLKLIPVKGDVLWIDDVKYTVLQRDIIFSGSEQNVRLFVRDY